MIIKDLNGNRITKPKKYNSERFNSITDNDGIARAFKYSKQPYFIIENMLANNPEQDE